MQRLSKQPAFELGQIVATPGALAARSPTGSKEAFCTGKLVPSEAASTAMRLPPI